MAFREHLGITKEIHRLLFSEESQRAKSMETINFYNKVKEIVIKSGEDVEKGDDTLQMFNFKVFVAMLKELRIKLDIAKEGLGPDKIMRLINSGLDENVQTSKQD